MGHREQAMGPRWCAGKARPRPNDRYLTAAFSCGIVNECNCELVLKNSVSAPNVKFWGIENVLRSEKIAYIASWRNFIFAIFAEMSFSTATLDYAHRR
jgi:hypothetical protein